MAARQPAESDRASVNGYTIKAFNVTGSKIVAFEDRPIPAHVPAALVRKEYPIIFGTTTDRDPFNDLAASVHEGPEIIYALHAYPGATAAWVPRRAQHQRTIFLDTEHFSSSGGTIFAKLLGETFKLSPSELDPPAHGPFRSLMASQFTPKAMARLEDQIRTHVRDYIARLAAKGSCELMSEFAFEFPIRIFLDLMGLPQERIKQFVQWEKDLIHNHDVESITETARSVIAYLRAEIEDRKSRPRDDLITFAVQARHQGQPLSNDDLIGFTFNLFLGGLDTVSTNTALHFLHLATHPDDQSRLRANPAEIPAAIEEMMRAYGSLTVFRTCIKAIEVNGVMFQPGDHVSLSATLSGRDPDEFPNPAEIRLDRKPRHMNFGYGNHLCLGRPLGLRELRIAMEEFLSKLPPFRLAERHVVRYHLGIIQPMELPLVW